MYGYMGEWMGGWTYKMDGWMNGWTDGRMNRWVGGWVSGYWVSSKVKKVENREDSQTQHMASIHKHTE